MRLFLVVFFGIILRISVLAQTHKGFRWIGKDHCLYMVDLKTQSLIKENLEKENINLGKLEGLEKIERDLPGDFDINTFYKGDSLYITIPGTGQYYLFDVNSKKIRRLDKTYFRGFNFYASQFFRNDTLFSIGGEGYWLKHSMITYYNSQTSEWDLYNTKNINNLPSNNKFSGYSKTNDSFFSAYLTVDSVSDQREIPFSIFDFKTKTWVNSGFITAEIKEFTKIEFRTLWTGEYLLVFRNTGNYHVVLIIDPFQNIVYKYDNTNNRFFINKSEVHYQNGFIYSKEYIYAGRMAEKIKFDSLRLSDLIKGSKIIGKAYQPINDKTKYFIILIFLILVIVGLFIFRRIKLKTHYENFTELEFLLFKEIMALSNGQAISSVDVNSILLLNDKSYDNQRQIRNRIISTLNQKFYNQLGAKELILRVSNKEDRRMMDYYINPDIKTKDLQRLSKQLNQNIVVDL